MQRKYRDLFRKHYGKQLDRLFAELTGIQPHISWAPKPAHTWHTENLPSGCSTCCCPGRAGNPQPADCRNCGLRRLRNTLKSSRGHVFTCGQGLRNYWLPVRVRGKTLGIAYLQAPAAPDEARERGWRRFTPARRSASNGRAAAQGRPREQPATGLTRSKFVRAARFLQHIIEQVQSASLADLRKNDLAEARRALRAVEAVGTPPGKAPDAALAQSRTAPQTQIPQPGSRPRQIVNRLVERMESDYVKSITLRHYARELDLNPAYLSALFSQVIGLPFKAYLTGLRIDKAKVMLGDPAKNPSQVAYAVGYTSENRFRSAFKKVTGFPPKLWREAMPAQPPSAPALPAGQNPA